MTSSVFRNRGAHVNKALAGIRASAEPDTLVGSTPCPAPPHARLSKDSP
jgi:hypothetical protein